MYTRETACPFPIYADPTRKLYDMLGMTKALSLGHSPEYLQRSLFSMAFSSFLQELRSGRKMLSGGDFRQVGGELLFSGGKVTFCKRMKNTRDHAELPEIRKHLGLDRIVNSSSDGEKPETKKRWSSSGLGAGLGRRLSFQRRSWAPARSASKNNEAKGNPPRNAMQEVKEEGAEANASATPEDALAKLEGKRPANEKGMNGEPINGPANGIINGAVKEKQTENGAVLNGSVDDATNGAPNGHVTA